MPSDGKISHIELKPISEELCKEHDMDKSRDSTVVWLRTGMVVENKANERQAGDSSSIPRKAGQCHSSTRCIKNVTDRIQAGMGASGEMILDKTCWITKPTQRVDREVGPRAAERAF